MYQKQLQLHTHQQQISIQLKLWLQEQGHTYLLNLPKTMTKVILMVLTLALGMRPRELARRQSGSLSRAIRFRRASVIGTEIFFLISIYREREVRQGQKYIFAHKGK